MKTSVEWLYNEWAKNGTIFLEDLEQAKQMEKQQIIQFANEWYEDYCEGSGNFKYPEDYYNETFKSK